MLSAELALRLEPVVEEVRTSLDNFQALESYVVEPLSLIVGVYLLQALVENVGKLVDVGRLLRELYEPLVAALSLVVHVDRGGGVL